MNVFNPIPLLTQNRGWREIPIRESQEPLVEMKDNQYFILAPQYYQQGIPGAINKVYVREGVYKRLVKAAKLLQNFKPGYKLVILDAWRPPAVQKALFEKYYQKLQKENVRTGNKLSAREVHEATQRFVSVPSLEPQHPSPHFTGGAVDLTYADEKGNWSKMGTGFDDFTTKAATDYFESEENLKNLEKETSENRRLLYAVMKEVGFVSYHEEWWHYDFGNQFAAQIGKVHGHETVAKYGLVASLEQAKVVRAENLGQNSLKTITQTALDLKRTTSPTKTKVKQPPEREIC